IFRCDLPARSSASADVCECAPPSVMDSAKWRSWQGLSGPGPDTRGRLSILRSLHAFVALAISCGIRRKKAPNFSGARVVSNELEGDLQCQLNITRIAGVEDFVIRTAVQRRAQARDGSPLSEVHVVQRVEELGAELRVDSLADLGVLKDRSI